MRRGDLPSPVPRHPPAPLTERQRDESSKNRGFAKPALYTEDLASDVRGRYPLAAHLVRRRNPPCTRTILRKAGLSVMPGSPSVSCGYRMKAFGGRQLRHLSVLSSRFQQTPRWRFSFLPRELFGFHNQGKL